MSRDLSCDGAKQRPSWIILLTRHQTPDSTKGKGYPCKPGITEGYWDPESHPSVNQQLWGTCWLLSPHIPTLGIPCTNTSSLARWASGPHYHTTKLVRNSSALRIQSNPINPNASSRKPLKDDGKPHPWNPSLWLVEAPEEDQREAGGYLGSKAELVSI